MKTLILVAAAATLFVAGAVNAADNTKKNMTRPECELAMAACENDKKDPDACKQNLINNGCTYGMPTQ